MEQDGKLLSEGISIFHLYDRHGRECITGTCRNKMNDASWQSSSVYCEYIGEKGTFLGYNVSGITLESPKIIKTNYYDNYNFINLIDEDMSFRQREAGDTYKTSPATLLTGFEFDSIDAEPRSMAWRITQACLLFAQQHFRSTTIL